jgi:hypothetical protein
MILSTDTPETEGERSGWLVYIVDYYLINNNENAEMK